MSARSGGSSVCRPDDLPLHLHHAAPHARLAGNFDDLRVFLLAPLVAPFLAQSHIVQIIALTLAIGEQPFVAWKAAGAGLPYEMNATARAPTLTIRLLGDFSLIYGDEPVDGITTPRLRSLFAYLALHHDAPQFRQDLAFLFWPDSSEAQARNNLRQILHELRHAWPHADQFLRIDARTVSWQRTADIQIDVAEFERALALAETAPREGNQRAVLEHATRLYRADLLPGCYDDWIGPERERLRQRHRQGALRLIALLEAGRDYAEAISHAQHLLRADPLDEEVVRCLMHLLALNNDRAGALRVYERCVAVFQRELGIEPGELTRELYESLLHTDPVVAPRPERQPMPDATLPLIGRQREWEQLRAAWDSTRGGAPCFVLISGEAGIGKSRLAEEAITWAHRQGITASATRSYAAEGQLSLAPVTDWLRSEAVRTQLGRLAPVWLSEVSRILPELLAERPDLPPHKPITEYGQRQRFFEALARAMLAAEQPLMLLIDDLQWCDKETLEWLHFLMRFDAHAPLLLIGTVRDDEVPPLHPLRDMLLHLRSTIRVVDLVLQPLDAAETARLAAQLVRSDLDVAAAMQLYRETEGNPLFVVETVRARLGSAAATPTDAPPDHENRRLPIKVQAVIAGRLAQLSAPARELAGLAAAIGRAFTLDMLIEAGRADEDRVVQALDELWQKRIVREQGANSYDFSHDKLREVTYAEISAPQRRLLHRRIARTFETIYANALDPISGQIAAHYERAGHTEQALLYYQRAAAVAQGVYANADAIALLVRGLALLEQLPPGAQRDMQELSLQLALAPLYRMTEGWTSPEVERVMNRAMELCDRVGSDGQRAQALYGMQSLYVVQARLEKAQLISEELNRLYQRIQHTPAPLEAEMMLMGSRLHLGQLAVANEAFEHMLATNDPTQVQRIVEEQGWNFVVHGRVWQAYALWLLGYPDTALRRALEGVQLAHELGQPFNQALAATYLALLQQLRADAATARAQAEAALTFTTEYKAPYYRTWSAILVSYALACEQPGAPAIERLRASIDDFKASGARLRLPYYLGLLADVCGRAGRAGDGLAAIDEAMSEARTHSERLWDAELHRLRGELLLASGAPTPDCETAYLRSIEIARDQQARGLELRATMSLARLWQRQRRADPARRMLSDLYTWFTEGFDTPDLLAAQALLAEL